jgi:hypothetical protein
MTQVYGRLWRGSRLWASLAVVACAAAAAGGCGGDEEKSSSPVSTAEQAAAPEGAADPRSAIQAWFTAKRLGKGDAGCALESDDYQTQQYGSPGQPCLDDEANKQPQTVWAEQIRIVSLKDSGDSALATVEPNAGTAARAQIGLVKTGGGWLVDTFR